MTALFEPARLGPLTLRNRVIKAATFEGRSPDGLVTDDLIEFHAEVAAGGAAMSTVAYLSVAPEGRTDAGCILLVPDAVAGLRRLTDAIHERGALAQAQIGHAGPVANASSNRARSLAPGRMFNPLGLRFTKAADDDDIARVTADYERGARLCVDAGFDSLEVHIGHNYLLSSFLSPKFNRRTDRWGGSIENRARFARQVVTAVRAAAGSGVAVTAKLNMTDGYRGGLAIDESLEVAALLEADGALDAIELTAGSSLANPMYLFKGAAPTREFGATLPWYLRGGFRLVGDKFLRTYPYEEAYFLDQALRFREALDLPLILLGGISELATAERGLAAGFEFVAMGRAILHHPGIIDEWARGTGTTSGCIHCNRCMPTIYTGTRCPLVEPRPGDRPIEVPSWATDRPVTTSPTR
ncbi:NADH:flavin oxidoreductase [Aquihabitans daechungensis]|uniref:oxidoreductase n=1 Tax=Aquihabitans daechungensis TaxID=1052257 RepID=UPI003B9EDD83